MIIVKDFNYLIAKVLLTEIIILHIYIALTK